MPEVFGAEIGERLEGGNVADVVRVGDTVRRSTGPWTASVHELLRFLEADGYDFSPRVLGLDLAGREVLGFLEGDVGFYPLPDYMWSEDALEAVVRALRQLHDRTAHFTPSPGAVWREQAGTFGHPEVICHTDWSPYNAVFEKGRFVAMLDWDLANPGSRVWDLAWVAFTWVPLVSDADARALGWSRPPDRAARLRRLVECYGLDAAGRHELLPAVRHRLAVTAEWIERRALLGDPPFVRMRDEGHAEGYRRHVLHLRNQWGLLAAALSS
ncbi:MAG: phosphotransferase [Mycobacteriales bacterium]